MGVLGSLLTKEKGNGSLTVDATENQMGVLGSGRPQPCLSGEGSIIMSRYFCLELKKKE